jgi:hypothetical protein
MKGLLDLNDDFVIKNGHFQIYLDFLIALSLNINNYFLLVSSIYVKQTESICLKLN